MKNTLQCDSKALARAHYHSVSVFVPADCCMALGAKRNADQTRQVCTIINFDEALHGRRKQEIEVSGEMLFMRLKPRPRKSNKFNYFLLALIQGKTQWCMLL